MYNLTDDRDIALHNLLCKDSYENTIIHLLARKGDSNKKTMKALLDLSLSDGSKMFKILQNNRKQYPIHIAAQSVSNQPETIKLLYEHMPGSFEELDAEGMTALHYASQRSTDVNLVQTLLSYKKDNINVINKDGLSALDLISRRSRLASQSEGLFSIDESKQEAIRKLIKNNGGTVGSCLPNSNGNEINCSEENPGIALSPPQHTAESPTYSSDPFLASSHAQSPSGSDHFGSTPSLLSSQVQQCQPIVCTNPLSVLQGSPHKTYEDHLASELLSQFPEISTVLGQILETEQQ